MVIAETSQDGDSVVPPTVDFVVPPSMLLQKWDNIFLWCKNTVVSIIRAHFGGGG